VVHVRHPMPAGRTPPAPLGFPTRRERGRRMRFLGLAIWTWRGGGIGENLEVERRWRGIGGRAKLARRAKATAGGEEGRGRGGAVASLGRCCVTRACGFGRLFFSFFFSHGLHSCSQGKTMASVYYYNLHFDLDSRNLYYTCLLPSHLWGPFGSQDFQNARIEKKIMFFKSNHIFHSIT
jgi:hypothetical protein